MTSTATMRETLPTNVRPKEYSLSLRPDLNEGTFSGSVHVLLEVREPSRAITLNAVDLDLLETSVAHGGATQVATAITYDVDREQATLHFAEEIHEGSASLLIRFAAKLGTSMVGFYLNNYEVNGVKKRAASTQFEATHARRAFPCWDEPAIKATFDVVLDIEAKHVGISNGEVRTVKPMPNKRKLVQFETTPVMSTYILAFVVGEFECIEKVSKTGTVLRMWTTAGKCEQGRFALDVTDRILSYFTDYFGVAYPLPKLDQIAVPDFAFGAMENWGAIIYREVALLVNEGTSTMRKQRVVEYLAHEIAHQWYGNLVTMEWWEDLWLNESFATHMGAKCTMALFPEFDLMPQFVQHECCSGMHLDGLENTHPIHVEVPSARHIDEIFDAISYNKGGACLRMLEELIGYEAFRKAMRTYMPRHSYGTTVANDLWQCFEEASGQPVRDIMDCWTHQPGYPVLHVHSSRTPAGRKPKVSQQRFRYGSICEDNCGTDTQWQIPVLCRTDKGTHAALVTEQACVIELPDGITAGASFLHLNAHRAGFYRVNYDAASLAELLPAIASMSLSTTERIGVEDDAYALCRTGHLSASQYLTIASAYAGETEYAVWANLIGHLAEMRFQFGSEKNITDSFDSFGRALVGGIAAQVGWDPDLSGNESHSRAMLRPLVLGFAATCGDQDIIAEAQLRFEDELNGGTPVTADLRSTVYGIVARHGDATIFERLQSLYRKTESAEEKERLLRNIGKFRSRGLREAALEWMLTDEVRAQDAMLVLGSVANTDQVGAALVWDFVSTRWDEIAARYASNTQMLTYFVTFSTENLCHKSDANRVRVFFAKTKPAGLDRTIAQAIERVTHNVAWRAANVQAIRQWSAQSHSISAEV